MNEVHGKIKAIIDSLKDVEDSEAIVRHLNRALANVENHKDFKQD